MPIELPAVALEMLATQAGVVARRQAAILGLANETMRNQERSGRWKHPQRGVYFTFTGDPGRDAVLWAALLRAGADAALSHQTAAERHGLVDKPSALVHITVPAARRPAQQRPIPGVVIHRSNRIFAALHPVMVPPCTRVEDTVLDLIEAAPSFDDAYVWLCRAVGRRRTTAQRLLSAMAARRRMRWRADVAAALGEVGEGILSLLERRYVHGVERAHGLPRAQRQQRIRQATGAKYLDNFYQEYGVCVELDGTAAHPADEQWRDKRRDNWNLIHQEIVTLRFGFLDLGDHRCETARDVATRLRRSGWPGTPNPCPRCAASPIQDRG